MEFDLPTIITLVLSAVGVFFGGTLLVIKGKLKTALSVLKLVVEALEDDKVTEEELQAIIAEAKKMVQKEKV